MKEKFILVVLGTSLLSACSRKEEAPQTAENAPLPPEQAAQIEAQFLPATNAPAGATIQERLQGAVHPELTAHLRMFIDKRGRMPENFYELSYASFDSVPPVPDGMKFEIDPADKTVKLVRK